MKTMTVLAMFCCMCLTVFGTDLAVTNGGFEESTGAMGTPANNWVGNSAWYDHSAAPKPNSGTLGLKFGYYTPSNLGGVWMAHEMLVDTYQSGQTYNFNSWAVGGDNNMGLATYEIGYLNDESNYLSFVQLDRTTYSLNGVSQWDPYAGAFHTVRPGATEIGRRIVVRFGICNSDDIWVDKIGVSVTNIPLANFPATPTNVTPVSGAVGVSKDPTLNATAFSAAGGTHNASDWQVSTDASFLRTTDDSGITLSALTSYAPPVGTLANGTRYYWRVKYRDSNANWSSWSPVTYFNTETTNIPLNGLANGGFEESTGTMGAPAINWVGNNAWYLHSSAPKPNSSTLGLKFGYYTPLDLGGVWMGHDLLDSTFQVGQTYIFKSWAVGGGNNMGLAAYEIGYLADDADYNSFVQVDRTEYSLDYVTQWEPYAGSFHTVMLGAPEVGRKIMVRFGKSASDDVWIDKADIVATNIPVGLLPDAPSNLAPPNGATDVGLTPTLTASVYQASSGSPHAASIWQVSSDGTFLMPEFSSGITTESLTRISVPEGKLAAAKTYAWRVKYCDSEGRWSAWSPVTIFTTPFRYLRNGGFENNPGSIMGQNPPDQWGPGPSNLCSWASHAAYPRPGNGPLGSYFAYLNPYPPHLQSMMQTTALVYTEGNVYKFSSYAYPGISDTGIVCYAFGYLEDVFDPSSFQALAISNYNITGRTMWEWYPGVEHAVTNGAYEIGKPIIVAFIPDQWMELGDIWVDEALLEVIPEPALAFGLVLVGVLGCRRRN